MKLILCSAIIFLMFLHARSRRPEIPNCSLAPSPRPQPCTLMMAFFCLGLPRTASVRNSTKRNGSRTHRNIQKRMRVIRAKLKAVSQRRITDLDRQLIRLLDNGYACMDLQAWALIRLMEKQIHANRQEFREPEDPMLGTNQDRQEFLLRLATGSGITRTSEHPLIARLL